MSRNTEVVAKHGSAVSTARGSALDITQQQSSIQPNKLILGCWNIRGASRGNPARYLLSYAKADWEDKQYTFGQQEWSQAKPTLMPFANLPHIIDGNFKVTETIAVH